MWGNLILAMGISMLGAEGARFVGAQSCKLCHRAAYAAWATTPHANATRVLGPAGDSPACLRCHGPAASAVGDGAGLGPGFGAQAGTQAKPRAMLGVQCEACHGAGSDYWPAEVMMDPEKARAAGLKKPNEALCRSCHGSGLPGHRETFSMPRPEDLSRTVH